MTAFIPDDVVVQVIAASDIVEVIEGYLPLKRVGRSYKALCPFHAEKTPSFIVNPERQIFKCFGCGEGRDVVNFLMRQERFTFPEAVRYLAQRAGIPLPSRGTTRGEEGRLTLYEVHRLACGYYRRNLSQADGAKARAYLEARGVGGEVAERFLLGYALPSWEGLLRSLTQQGFSPSLLEQAGLVVHRSGKQGYYDRFRDRLMIPIQDAVGRVIGFGGRSLDGSEPKYLNSPETPIYRKGSHLYGLHLAAPAIRERGFAIVVEGYFDVISLHVHGLPNSVAVLGTALTTEQARLFTRYAKRAVLVFDPDQAGLAAAKRGVEALINSGIEWKVTILPEGKDPDSYVRAYGEAAFAEELEQAKDLIEFLWDRRASGLDMQDPDDQAKGLNEIFLPLLAVIEDHVVRAGYTQKLLQKIGLSNVAVVEQLNRLVAQGRKVRGGIIPPPKAPASAERTLVHIALHDPAARRRLLEAIEPGDFDDPLLRRVFMAQREAAGRGMEEILISQQDPEIREVLTELLAMDLKAYEGAVEKVVSDCIDRLKARRERREREGLRRSLEEAERSGDQEAIERLLRAFRRP